MKSGSTTSERMPALFVGHGSPMNAITANEWTRAWRDIGSTMPRPKAILSISAHWLTQNGLLVTAGKNPKMTYDMGGFPAELYQQQYPAPGNPALAEDIETTVQTKIPIHGDTAWGFDHGTWVVLKHMFPKADIPVIQLSLDYSQPPSFHYELARLLRPLRDKGVLILGSGNIVHNLRVMNWQMPDTGYDWAIEMNEKFKSLIASGDHASLTRYEALGKAAMLSVPTPEHYLPLIYTLGLKEENESVAFFNDKTLMGSVSMTSLKIV